MNNEVARLYDELRSASAFDPSAMRERIVRLFGEVDTEEDRVHLLTILHVLNSAVVRSFETEGRDTTDLLNASVADKRTLALKEAMGANELADPVELLRVLDREIAAGRMEKDDYYQLVQSGAEVIGPPVKRRNPLKLFRRN